MLVRLRAGVRPQSFPRLTSTDGSPDFNVERKNLDPLIFLPVYASGTLFGRVSDIAGSTSPSYLVVVSVLAFSIHTWELSARCWSS